MTFNITAAPLPTNFRGTPQEFFDAILDRLSVEEGSGAGFVISDVEPDSNQGPWLKNGRQWYVWSEEVAAYVPADITASESELIHIGETAPDPAVTQLWLKLSGANVLGLFYYAGSTAGWVAKAAELVADSIDGSTMIKPASIGSSQIKPGAIIASLLAENLPLSKFAKGNAEQVVRMKNGNPQWDDLIYQSEDLPLTSAPSKVEFDHGLDTIPRYVRAVLVCTEAQGNWPVGAECDPKQDCHATDTKVGCIMGAAGIVLKNYNNPGTPFNPSTSKWKVRIYYAA